jgi:hypothetical protein
MTSSLSAFPKNPGGQSRCDLHGKTDIHKGGSLASVRFSLSALLRRVLRPFLISPVTQEIGKELCALPRRIRALRQSTLCIWYGSLQADSLDRLGNKQTRACTRDTQDALRSHPWATRLDHYLFVLGWQSGAEWAGRELGIPCSDRVHTSQAAWSGSRRSGNSMPLPGAQQSSKSDSLGERDQRKEAISGNN